MALLACTKSTALEEQFYIDTGDVIVIAVYNERDLNVKARIDKTGELKLPLIGRVNVIGKTSRELADELEHAYLDGYLVAPNVSVVIETFRPFFIKGAVKAVGAYDFQFNLSVDEAIAVAGGLTERASKHAWFIIRGQDKQKIKVSPEHSIHPGDIVIIEESLF